MCGCNMHNADMWSNCFDYFFPSIIGDSNFTSFQCHIVQVSSTNPRRRKSSVKGGVNDQSKHLFAWTGCDLVIWQGRKGRECLLDITNDIFIFVISVQKNEVFLFCESGLRKLLLWYRWPIRSTSDIYKLWPNSLIVVILSTWDASQCIFHLINGLHGEIQISATFQAAYANPLLV